MKQLVKSGVKTASTVCRVTLRSQQIAYLCSRYALLEGVGAVGLTAGVKGLAYLTPKKGKLPTLDRVYGRKLAKTFAKLGPTFIKLGQVLALRSDVVGESVSDELRVLFDRVPPVSFAKIRKIINQELGRAKVREQIASIEPLPLASASIAQVHRARLKDGTAVLLKVQKPGVARLVRVDLSLLGGWAKTASLMFPHLNLWQMFEDFRDATLKEVDYVEEAKNIDRFRKNFHKWFGDSDVVFPSYYPDLSTKRVITMEPLHGKKLDDLKKGTTVARKAAAQSVTAVLEQIFEHGFFHADPHGGNLFFMEDGGNIGFIDLGLVGQLKESDKRKFLKVLLAVLNRDRDNLARALFDLGTPGKRTDFDKFQTGIQELLDQVKAKGIHNIKVEALLNDLLKVARKNSINVPNRYVMMMRSFLIIEGVAKSLDPDISLFKIAPPIVTKSLLKSYNPFRFFRS